MAGTGSEKPILLNAAPSFARLMPPMLRPKRFDPHAITVPTKMATRPAGMFFGYFTPPNQLARITAKQVRPITGVMNISKAGRIEMKATETPASVPSSAARGVMR